MSQMSDEEANEEHEGEGKGEEGLEEVIQREGMAS